MRFFRHRKCTVQYTVGSIVYYKHYWTILFIHIILCNNIRWRAWSACLWDLTRRSDPAKQDAMSNDANANRNFLEQGNKRIIDSKIQAGPYIVGWWDSKPYDIRRLWRHLHIEPNSLSHLRAPLEPQSRSAQALQSSQVQLEVLVSTFRRPRYRTLLRPLRREHVRGTEDAT